MDFPAEVRAEMGRQGMRAQTLAEKSGLSETQISRKITRESSPITLEESILFANALGLPLSELMRRAETAKKVAS